MKPCICTDIHGSCTLVLQGVELFNADGASTAKEIDSLKQDVQDRDEEIKRLTSPLEEREEMAVRGGGGKGGAGEGGEGGSGEEEWEESDLWARLEEAEDRRMRAEEELKNLQSRLTEREKVTGQDLVMVPHNKVIRRLACIRCGLGKTHRQGQTYSSMFVELLIP